MCLAFLCVSDADIDGLRTEVEQLLEDERHAPVKQVLQAIDDAFKYSPELCTNNQDDRVLVNVTADRFEVTFDGEVVFCYRGNRVAANLAKLRMTAIRRQRCYGEEQDCFNLFFGTNFSACIFAGCNDGLGYGFSD